MRLLVLLPLFASGCFWFTSKEQGDALRRDLDHMEVQLQQSQLREADLSKQLDGEVKRLHQVVDEATRIVERNSADVGLKVQRLEADMATVHGKLDDLADLANQIATLKKSIDDWRAATDNRLEKLENELTKVQHPPVPETADAVFAEGQAKLATGAWADARRDLEAFVVRYPNDARAPRAQVLDGDAYMGEGRAANAIQAYRRVLDNWPKSDAVPEAMYKSGLAFYQIKYCTDARIFFLELVKRFPKSAQRRDAEAQLKKLAKDLKNKSVCAS